MFSARVLWEPIVCPHWDSDVLYVHGQDSRDQEPGEFLLNIKCRLRRLGWEGLRSRVCQERVQSQALLGCLSVSAVVGTGVGVGVVKTGVSVVGTGVNVVKTGVRVVGTIVLVW